jgi:hypothetical protein
LGPAGARVNREQLAAGCDHEVNGSAGAQVDQDHGDQSVAPVLGYRRGAAVG